MKRRLCELDHSPIEEKNHIDFRIIFKCKRSDQSQQVVYLEIIEVQIRISQIEYETLHL